MGQLRRASAHYTALKDRPAYATRAENALAEIDDQLAVASAAEGESAAEKGGEKSTVTASASKAVKLADDAAAASGEGAPAEPTAPNAAPAAPTQAPSPAPAPAAKP
jgi:hypothetical protein